MLPKMSKTEHEMLNDLHTFCAKQMLSVTIITASIGQQLIVALHTIVLLHQIVIISRFVSFNTAIKSN